jgi:hypothetical protein
VGSARAGDDPNVRLVVHGLVEASAARRPGVGGLLDAAAGKRRGRGAIAQKLSDGLFQRVDVEAQLRERLPKRSQGAAAALTATLQNTVGPAAADRLLQRPRVQELWKNINKRAHAAVVKALEGKDLGTNGNISTANGEATLDLRPAITRLAIRLGLYDKLKANADPNAGQLVIMKSSQLKAAQTAVKILKALSSLLLIAVVALYALAIYLAKGGAGWCWARPARASCSSASCSLLSDASWAG